MQCDALYKTLNVLLARCSKTSRFVPLKINAQKLQSSYPPLNYAVFILSRLKAQKRKVMLCTHSSQEGPSAMLAKKGFGLEEHYVVVVAARTYHAGLCYFCIQLLSKAREISCCCFLFLHLRSSRSRGKDLSVHSKAADSQQ